MAYRKMQPEHPILYVFSFPLMLEFLYANLEGVENSNYDNYNDWIFVRLLLRDDTESHYY